MKLGIDKIEKLGFKRNTDTYIEVLVMADFKDADFIKELSRIPSFKEYEVIALIFNKILGKNLNRLRVNGELSEEEFKIIYPYIPELDNEEAHTVEGVEYTFIINGIVYN